MPFAAVLLLGPTGSGKTPVGEWLEQHSLWKRRCHHFDFGANLRAVAMGGASQVFNAGEIQFLNDVLEKGALLEDASFYLAERILEQFIARRNVQPSHLLLLNGLPRHVGQSEKLDHRLKIMAVVQLECDAPTVRERLRLDSGGDRAQRTDDDEMLVAQKLAIFAERTRPLAEHYRQRGARLITVNVGVETRPAAMVEHLETFSSKLAPIVAGSEVRMR